MKSSVFILTILVWVLGIAGCANKTPLVPTQIVPAAAGEVNLSSDNNDNTKVELKVKYLAPPAALSPPRSAYVVWTRTGSADPEKQGVLEVGDNREGKIEFITSARNFEVLVTAEESPDVRYPSSTIALQSNVNR